MEFERQYDAYRTAAERYLAALFTGDKPYGILYEAMRYSLLAGGKRVRPVLTLEFCRACGGEWERALPFACALELVHTYSLIHDDLPCMDDDDLRRGKPTNHKVFGETVAVLAGDALQPEAYRLLAEAEGMSDRQRTAAVRTLARASGADGMVAGQILDLRPAAADIAAVTELHRHKTGAMIAAAARLGCIAADADAARFAAAEEYAAQVGLAFQIRDDVLDVTGDERTFGKPIGSDREEGKVTFYDLLGADGCAAEIRRCTDRAKAALTPFSDGGFLAELAERLAAREK